MLFVQLVLRICSHLSFTFHIREISQIYQLELLQKPTAIFLNCTILEQLLSILWGANVVELQPSTRSASQNEVKPKYILTPLFPVLFYFLINFSGCSITCLFAVLLPFTFSRLSFPKNFDSICSHRLLHIPPYKLIARKHLSRWTKTIYSASSTRHP